MNHITTLRGIMDSIDDSLREIPHTEEETEQALSLRRKYEELYYSRTGRYYSFRKEERPVRRESYPATVEA